jgi:hypothetical protein
MAIIKNLPWLRDRIRIELSELGYEVRVYGQTVKRSDTYREATRFAASLRHALRKRQSVTR